MSGSSSNEGVGGSGGETQYRSNQNGLIMILSIFSEWTKQFKYYLSPSSAQSTTTMANKSNIFSFDAIPNITSESKIFIEKMLDENIVQRNDIESSMILNTDVSSNEGRARSSLKSSITNVASVLSVSSLLETVDQTIPLPEHIELRGFLPFLNQYEVFIRNI